MNTQLCDQASSLRGDVVSVRSASNGVAVIEMHDEAGKNTFTEELTTELAAAFERVGSDEQLRAVVLTGYGPYFCSGGTLGALLDIQDGQNTFLGAGEGPSIYTMPLTCPIPVVAAMQGHAIGGGFSLGLFADVVVLAREAVYSASFMKYGFTPGFGSTLIFPEKLGLPLAEELLLGARTYRGAELASRGVPFEVAPRGEVLDRALVMAERLADKPRRSLITLKAHLVRHLLEQLPHCTELELAMHEITIHEPEVRERLISRYSA